ncbi:MAG: hypothetical protein CMH60_03195 [Myxococcales bacterium]|nr:hypothetical protein [Myxococcales bacterium]|tara:strand:+ start:661 stop:942 length:282 start_codon:yes stop_codon:yes gene_type:complete
MSFDAVTQFLIKLGNEQAVYEGLRLVMAQPSSGVQTIVEFAQGHGFEFTSAEFNSVVKGALKLDGDLEAPEEPYAFERISRLRRERSKMHPMD